MNYTDKLMKLASLRYSGEDYGRICTEICFLDGVAKGCGRFCDVIEEAADYVLSAPITKERVENAERILSPMAKEAKSYTLLFMAHAHIDMNWMWGMQETAVVATDTMRTMLDLMNEFPDFTFSQSQASVYRIVAETSPDMLEEIKSRVKEGRWEITASHWTEADKNLPDGESLTRQILCAKKYLGELFGLPQDYFCIDFEPDTFGYSANVPEILSDAGVKYLFHFRAKQEGKYLYNFVAPSGKRVLALRSFSGYSNRVDDRAVISTAEFCNMHGVKVCPFVYGVGDHGGGPSRVDIRRILKYRTYPLLPTIRFGTWHEFFTMVEPSREQFETVCTEQEELFTGCYTSQAGIKHGNSVCEARLNETEALTAMAHICAGGDNRQSVLEPAWQDLLFCQFHDILPGSCVKMSRDYAMGKYQDILTRVFPTANYAMRKIAAGIDTSGIPFDDVDCSLSEGAGVGWYQSQCMGFRMPAPERGRGSYRIFHFFNTTQYDREELSEFMVWDYNVGIYDAELVTPEGDTVPFAVRHVDGYYGGHCFSILNAKVRVAAYGWSTLILRPKKSRTDTSACSADQGRGYYPNRLSADGNGHLKNAVWVDMFCDRYISDNTYVLANENLRAVFDPMTLELISLTDRSGREYISAPAGYFSMITENARFGMTAWRVGERMNETNLNRTCNTHVYEYTRSGLADKSGYVGYLPGIPGETAETAGTGLCERLCYDMRFGSSSLKCEIGLDSGAETLTYRITVNWNEKGEGGCSVPQLSFMLPLPERGGSVCDIPYGLITREERNQDIPATTFIYSPANRLGLMSDCKHGFRNSHGILSVTLLRGSADPDPSPDIGDNYIALGIAPANDAVAMKRLSDLLCHPVCYSSGTSHKGFLPLCGNAVEAEGDGVRFTVLKCAEDGCGVILRAVNLTDETRTADIRLPVGFTAAYLSDSLENRISALDVTGGAVSAEIPPHSAVTVRIE